MTIRSLHTDNETRELLTEKASEIAQMKKAFDETLNPIWTMSDSVAAADYALDLQRLVDRFDSMRLKVETSLRAKELAMLATNPGVALGSAIISDTPIINKDLVIAEDEFQDILHALQVTPGAFRKGDFPDLLQRMHNAAEQLGISKDMPAFTVRQPTALDADLSAFKSADKVTKAVDKTVGSATSPVALVAAGAGLGLLGYILLKRVL